MPPMDDEPVGTSGFEATFARLGRFTKRHLAWLIVGGIVFDVAIVLGGLWWFGVFSSSAAGATLETCLSGPAEEVSTFEACAESVQAAADDPEEGETAVRALAAMELRCRQTVDRRAIVRCSDAPVVSGVLPEVSVRIRTEALMRLADYPRLAEESTDLIRRGDNYGYLTRGIARHATQDYEGAAKDYREAMRHFPDDPTLQDNLARAEVGAPLP